MIVRFCLQSYNCYRLLSYTACSRVVHAEPNFVKFKTTATSLLRHLGIFYIVGGYPKIAATCVETSKTSYTLRLCRIHISTAST